MDYQRVAYAQLPVRAMGSPDGLGAYYQTKWTKGISPDPGGTNTIAQYHAIVQATNGLGCGCSAPTPAAGLGDLSSMLASTRSKVVLGVGMIGVGLFLLRKRIWAHAQNGSHRRHRRNGRSRARRSGAKRR